MASRNKQRTVSAVIPPATDEELSRLASSFGITRSRLVCQMLEEQLTARANERQEKYLEGVERRLKKLEDRMAALLVKAMKQSAQSVYLLIGAMSTQGLRKEELDQLWKESTEYAARVAASSVAPTVQEESKDGR